MSKFSKKFMGNSPFKQTDPEPEKSTEKTKEEMDQLISSGVESETLVGKGGSGSIYKDPDSGRFYSGDTKFHYGEEMESDTIYNTFDPEMIQEINWTPSKWTRK
tara:strand:- start:589 stop:900 length:312 start_codon:yes stop_codon:yes gene_type:complete